MQRTDPAERPTSGTDDDLPSAPGEETNIGLQDYQRCFIALVPDPATRDALASINVPTTARRVPYEQLHLTVTFIGVLPQEKAAPLIDALTNETVPLNLTSVTRIEHWPRASHPRLTVATLAMSDEFVALDWRVRSSMISLGLPVDTRTFRPHVTLARYRHDASAVGPATELQDELIARFDSLTLYSSTLARTGARYRSLASVPVVYT